MQENVLTPWSLINLFADVHSAVCPPNLWRKIEPNNKVSPDNIESLRSLHSCKFLASDNTTIISSATPKTCQTSQNGNRNLFCTTSD